MMLTDVIAAEFAKLRRSKVAWITLGVYTFMAAMAGFLLWMMKEPEAAKRLGLLGQKASFAFGGQSVGWKTFLDFTVEMGGLGGLIVASIIAVYVFGREYAEGTAKNMLALPVPRAFFVAAKTAVAATWFLALTIWLIPVSCLAGAAVGLGALPAALLLSASGKLLALAAMDIACAMIAAWVAVETRGYFAALGFVIFSLVLASVFGGTGWAPWLPWSVVGLYSGAAGEGIELGWGSYATVALAFLVGTGLTLRHELFADNVQ